MHIEEGIVCSREAWWDRVHELVPFTGMRVLDVGSGNGVRTREISKRGCRFVEGIDPNEQAVNWANRQQSERASFRIGYAEQIPFPNESFDAVVCSLVVHHVQIDRMTLAIHEAVRVCKKNGRVIIIEPDAASEGTLYHAEVEFGIIDGNEEREKEAVRKLIQHTHDLEILETFTGETLYRGRNYHKICDVWRPRTHVDRFFDHLTTYHLTPSGYFEFRAPRTGYVCQPHY